MIVFYLLTLFLQDSSDLLWKFKTDGRVYSTPSIDKDALFVGSGDGKLYSLNKNNGNLNWSFEADTAIYSSPLVYGNQVYFSSMKGSLYSVDKKTGTHLWTHKTDDRQYGLWDYYSASPKQKDNNIFWGSGDGFFYSLNAETGKIKWKYNAGDVIHADAAFMGDTVYVSSFAGKLHALNSTTGKEVWTFKTVGSHYFPKGEIQRAPIVYNQELIFGSRDYNLYVLDAKKGTGRWNIKEPAGWLIASPIEYKGLIYYGSSDSHKFFCFNPKKRGIAWTIDINMRVYGSAYAHNDRIYFGSFNGKVYGVNYLTGKIEWQYQTEASKKNYNKVFGEDDHFRKDFVLYNKDYLKNEATIHSMGSVLSDIKIVDDIIYFTSSDTYVYALKL